MIPENQRDIIILLMILLAAQQTIQSRRVFKFTSIRCESIDKKFSAFMLCKLKAIQRDVNEVSVRVNLYKKPVDNITVRAEQPLLLQSYVCTITKERRSQIFGGIYKRGFENQPAMFEYNIDACAFMRNTRRNPFAATFYKVFGFEKYSNMNHTCPYDHDLIFERFRFDPAHIRLIPVPNGSYTIRMKWAVYNVPRAIIYAVFQIFETTV